MSAELRRVTNTEPWTLWANQVVNGAFPLRCFLGGSDHSAVYLTEYKAKGLADAAIKFVRADASQAKAQIAQWQATAALSHPHVVKLFAAGQCQIDGEEFLFVVMEYAEQALAQILQQRALSSEEVRELLLPTLDGLGFLHRNQLVHGQLRPSNILAVNDQLKLTSDTIRSAGHTSTGYASGTAYDPPELNDGGLSSAGDIWGLGMTLVEALTLRTAAWSDQQSETASLPANFPAPFAGMVRRCLSLAPSNRPTVFELGAPFKLAPPARVIAEPQASTPPSVEPSAPTSAHVPIPSPIPSPIPASVLTSTATPIAAPAHTQTPAPISTPPQTSAPSPTLTPPPKSTTKAPLATTPPKGFHKRHAVLATIAAVTLLPLAAWVGLRGSGNAEAELQRPVVVPPPPVALPVIAKPAETLQPALPPPDTSLAVLNEVIPDVPPAAQARIRGRIYVTVRVLVDPSGNVMAVLMENAGPSNYFAGLADSAAREWQFAPTDDQGPRVWLVRFQFTRDGVATRVTAQ